MTRKSPSTSKVIARFQELLTAPKPPGLLGLGALLAIAIDAGRYVASLEYRYQARSQRLGEVRTKNRELEKIINSQRQRIEQLESALAAVQTIELRGSPKKPVNLADGVELADGGPA